MTTQAEQAALMYNHMIDLMEARIGFTGLTPKLVLPKPPQTIRADNMTFNNIKVDKSVIGVINTGDVQKLDVAVSRVRVGGDPQMAEQFKILTEGILSSDLTDDEKNEALGLLAFLGEQAALPKPRRQASVGRAIVSSLEKIIILSAGLATIWATISPRLSMLF